MLAYKTNHKNLKELKLYKLFSHTVFGIILEVNNKMGKLDEGDQNIQISSYRVSTCNYICN